MAARRDFCIPSQGGSTQDEGPQQRPAGTFGRYFGHLKVAPVLQGAWQRESTSDKVYSLYCVDFPVGNNSPSRGV
jgi:hypothetical protein